MVEIKLTTYNLKKAGQAPVSITPESKDIKLEPGDQLIRIYKGKLIEVDVLDSGYKWKDEIYPTLTHISWKATGYKIASYIFRLALAHTNLIVMFLTDYNQNSFNFSTKWRNLYLHFYYI